MNAEPERDATLDGVARAWAAEAAPAQLKAAKAAEQLKQLETPEQPQETEPKPVDVAGARSTAALLVSLLDTYVPMFFGEHFKLKEPEQERLTEAAAPVVAKYLPELEMSPELTLVVTAGFIYGPRILMKPTPKPEAPSEQPSAAGSSEAQA